MTLRIREQLRLSSLVAEAGEFTGYSTSPFAFDSLDRVAVGFACGSLVSAAQALTIALQHSMDGSNAWNTIHNFSLSSGVAAANSFETASNQFKPLLPYGRICLGLAASGARAEWQELIINYLVEN